MITIDKLRKSFDGVEVLRGASLEVRDGEIVALIGPSGEGKSVFLKLVARLLTPDSGRIDFNGKDLCSLRRAELVSLRSRFGFLFQNGALFDSMTVYDNVAFPLREKTNLSEKEVREKVLSELEQVGLTGAEDKFPAQLSGGMAKRAALARALVRSPEIMLFDEPTTGLDPIIVHSIHALIASTHQRLGFSGILVSHEIPEVFSFVQKVAFLHEGVIRFVGTPAEIFDTADTVVRDFVRGSLPSKAVYFRDQASDQNVSKQGTRGAA
jgi:phospholipid/cholesterol/gamma-HCH transport system ATP-binding protein